MSTRTSMALGVFFIVLGLGVLLGHWMYDHEWHTWANVTGFGNILLGALLIDPKEVAGALGTLASVAKQAKDGTPPPGGT